MTYIPGIREVANPIHDVATAGISLGNQVLSPIVKTVNKGLETITPGVKWLHENTALGGINEFIENKPLDALGIAAATYFSGGAASKALGGGASTGIGAGSSAVGSSAITPTFASGAGATAAGTTAGAGASAITPAFASSGLSIAPAAASGGLGAAGTAAANSLLTPAFASWGGASGAGLLSGVKGAYNKFNQVDKYRQNLDRFAKNEPNERDRMNNQAGQLAERIIQQEQVPDIRSKIANQIMFNRFGMRR
jgi:hypothetical protein